MSRLATTHVRRNPISFTNEEVAILRAFEQLPDTATKAEIDFRAKQIIHEMKEVARKKFG